MRVLHVSESYAGGVAAAIQDYVSATPEYEHHLLYASRADAPLASDSLSGFVSVSELPAGHRSRISAMSALYAKNDFDVVHAHSSFAGAYARLAKHRKNVRIVYTPHCYAFERQDLSTPARGVYRALEKFLSSRTDVFAACSPREANLSRALNPKAKTVFVPNIAGSEISVEREFNSSSPDAPIVVLGAGRNGPQKDPDFFAACVRAARGSGLNVSATWIGGDSDLRRRLLADDIEVTGWLDRAEVSRMLSSADLYVHTAAWEGFPVALLESAAAGTPTVARKIPAYDGVDIPTFSSPEEFADSLERWVSDVGAQLLLSKSESAYSENHLNAQRAALMEAYWAN